MIKFAVFLAFALSIQSLAGVVEQRDLRLVVYSSTTCVFCKILKKNLISEGQFSKLTKIKTSSLPAAAQFQEIPILWQEIEEDTEWKKLGLKADFTPSIFLVAGDKVLKGPFPVYGNAQDLNSVGMRRTAEIMAPYVYNEDISADSLYRILMANGPVKSRVTLLGTGGSIADNPLFTAETIKNVRSKLESEFAVAESQFVTLYGSGPNSIGADALSSDKEGNEVAFRTIGVRPDAALTFANVEKVFQLNKDQKVKNALFVISGHGSPGGFRARALPGDDRKGILPAQFGQLAGPNTKNVMVSGICYGGIFAGSVDCGFFGAAPDTIATGCWTQKPSEVKDYASNFWGAVNSKNRSTITFEEAHWFAVANRYSDDVPYTSMDKLADEYLRKKEDAVPDVMSVIEAKKLLSKSTPSEKAAFLKLTQKMKNDDYIPLKALSVRQSVVEALAKGMKQSELNNAPANVVFEPTEMLLAQFVRRLIFENEVDSAKKEIQEKFKKVRACEQQSISMFLNGI